MVIKPIAFVTVAALVVVAAGTGAYLAVRADRDASTDLGRAATPSEVSLPDQTADAVDSTEEPITRSTELEVDTETASTAPVLPPPSRSEPDSQVAHTAEQPAPTEPSPTPPNTPRDRPDNPDRSATLPDAGPATRPVGDTGRPTVEGWERTSPVEPEAVPVPTRVALDTVDPATLGAAVAEEEPPRTVRELVISADSVIGLQLDTPVSTEDAAVEDDVQARVTRDVVVDDDVAIPAGTRVLGSVVLVEQPGELRGSARLGVRFHTVVLDDLYELPIVTETVYREGQGRGSESAAKIGGAAVGGAILGAILGGRQGAAIGGAAGAAGGTAAAMAGDGQPATLPAGSMVTVRLSRPATVTLEY